MPQARNYNPGSIVYFQNDLSDGIYVLQKGSVNLISTPLGQTSEIHEQVGVGEFFGVKSALGHYPHEETAQVVEPSSIVIFNIEEFENYMISNSRIIIKMMQVFSKELRELHVRLRSVLNVGREKNTAFELMIVAESFYKNHNLDHASYALNRYIEAYPVGKNINRAKELINSIKQGKTYPTNLGPPVTEEDSDTATRSELAANKLLKNNEESNKLSDSKIIKFYQKGHTAFSKGEYTIAIQSFTECLAQTAPNLTKEKEVLEVAEYEMGVALNRIKKHSEAMSHFTTYIRKYPTGEYVRNSIYQMGLIQEMHGDKNQAKVLYHKVATMQPHDTITAEARKNLLRVSGGGAS